VLAHLRSGPRGVAQGRRSHGPPDRCVAGDRGVAPDPAEELPAFRRDRDPIPGHGQRDPVNDARLPT